MDQGPGQPSGPSTRLVSKLTKVGSWQVAIGSTEGVSGSQEETAASWWCADPCLLQLSSNTLKVQGRRLWLSRVSWSHRKSPRGHGNLSFSGPFVPP